MKAFSNTALGQKTRSGALALAAAALLASTTLSLTTPGSAATDGLPTQNAVNLLTANFAPRQVVQVEIGDFHFKPGQTAPVHTHSAPAVGYVAKGQIIYQVEGSKPRILSAGDAFYEPVGPRILRFDNASATEEAIFLDFNLEQAGEPFIVFEQPLTEEIDRRTLPTIALDGTPVDQVDVYSSALNPGETLKLENSEPTLALVGEGVVELQVDGQPVQRVVAGGTFALPDTGAQATVVNASSEVPANLITFRVR